MTADHNEGSEARGYRVVGRVQGVGFRQWTLRTAKRLGLSGTVRNLPDGTVEVRARGVSAALRQLETELARGPLAARVERVESTAFVVDGAEEGFRIVP